MNPQPLLTGPTNTLTTLPTDLRYKMRYKQTDREPVA